jgi:uncharacterized protein
LQDQRFVDPANPTDSSERIGAIDILRGIALFIVLIINTATEFRVSIFEQFLPGMKDPGLANQVSEAVVLALHTKGFILFSFLFGVGLSIQFERLAVDHRRLTLMIRRLAILLALGVVHLFLIWNGDILTEYAIVGFAALPFLYGPLWLLGAASALSLAFYLASPWLPPMTSFPDGVWIARHLEEARQVYGSGGFRGILAFRINEVRYIAPLHVYALPRTLGLFLFGALIWRTGFFRFAAAQKSLVVATSLMLAIGAWMTIETVSGEAFGLPLNWRERMIFQSLGQLILACGYGAAVIILANHATGRKLVGWAGPLGRMAFTNYIIQSIILSWIFYGFGLALFGRLNVPESLAIAVAIYVAQAAFSAWWLRRFRFGPIEWLWRSLMYGKLQRVSRPSAPSTGYR